jgi:MFS family permease
LIEALDVSRMLLSIAYMVGTIGSACMLTWAGRMYDRYGARLIGVVSAVCLGCVLMVMSCIHLLAGAISGAIGENSATAVVFVLLALGFFGLRFFGQGVLTMTSRNMVMKWFDRRRGLANGVLGISVSLGFSASPGILHGLIQHVGWAVSWRMMALLVGCVFVFFASIFFRDNPQQVGLLPDGHLEGPRHRAASCSTSRESWTLHEAIRSFTFWPFNLGLTMFSLYLTAMTFHVVSIFEAAGYDAKQAFAIFLPAAVVGVGLQFAGSWASDYIRLKWLLLLETIGLALSMLSLIMLPYIGMAIPMLILGNAMATAGFSVLIGVTWPRYYGTEHLGAVSGFSMGWIVVGSAIGPAMFSLGNELAGSYSAAIALCLLITLAVAAMSFRANPPTRAEV